jgi:hypothetical protein
MAKPMKHNMVSPMSATSSPKKRTPNRLDRLRLRRTKTHLQIVRSRRSLKCARSIAQIKGPRIHSENRCGRSRVMKAYDLANIVRATRLIAASCSTFLARPHLLNETRLSSLHTSRPDGDCPEMLTREQGSLWGSRPDALQSNRPSAGEETAAPADKGGPERDKSDQYADPVPSKTPCPRANARMDASLDEWFFGDHRGVLHLRN